MQMHMSNTSHATEEPSASMLNTLCNTGWLCQTHAIGRVPSVQLWCKLPTPCLHTTNTVTMHVHDLHAQSETKRGH